MRVVWTREATEDLENVLAYNAARNPAAAASVAERIDRALDDIVLFPRSARLDPETGCREAVVRGLPLPIIYMLTGELIEIIAVFHTSRDPASKRRAGTDPGP